MLILQPHRAWRARDGPIDAGGLSPDIPFLDVAGELAVGAAVEVCTVDKRETPGKNKAGSKLTEARRKQGEVCQGSTRNQDRALNRCTHSKAAQGPATTWCLGMLAGA
jgi:hypothetical protein